MEEAPEDMSDQELSRHIEIYDEGIRTAGKDVELRQSFQTLKEEIEDEISYRKRQEDKGEKYVPPIEVVIAHTLGQPVTTVVDLGGGGTSHLYTIRIPGSVYDDCVNQNCSEFLRENPKFIDAESTVRAGRGYSVRYTMITREMVDLLLDHLDCYRVSRRDSEAPEDKEMSYRIKETMDNIKRVIK